MFAQRFRRRLRSSLPPALLAKLHEFSSPEHDPSQPEAGAAPVEPSPHSGQRRSTTSVRQLALVEEQLDLLLDRFSKLERRQRESDHRQHELLDRLLLGGERQLRMLERGTQIADVVERRLERLEQALSRPRSTEASTSDDQSSRRTRFAPSLSDLSRELLSRESQQSFSQESQIPAAAGQRPRTHPVTQRPSAPARTSPRPIAAPSGSGPTLHGSVSDMSLTTLLSMFELERRSGVLQIETTARSVELHLREGKLSAALLNSETEDPVLCLREALAWPDGYFNFEPHAALDFERADELGEPPRSIGSALLEATQLSDEALAAGDA